MAEPQEASKQIGVTPGKMVLIGVLAVTLIGVLYAQYDSDDAGGLVLPSTDPTSQAPGPASPSRPNAASEAPLVPADVEKELTDEPIVPLVESPDPSTSNKPDLATIVRYDPFALPSAFPRPVVTADPRALLEGGTEGADEAKRAGELADAVAKMRSELDELQQRGVHVIVKQRDQYVAMIGDRTIHVGDEINGFTVTAIEPDGVRVERKVQE